MIGSTLADLKAGKIVVKLEIMIAVKKTIIISFILIFDGRDDK